MNWLRLPREGALLLLVLATAVAFGITTDGFGDPLNLADRSRHWVEIGLIAVPMTFIIASGGIDLSVGSLLALAGIVSGLLHQAGWPLWIVVAVSLLVGLAGGLGNALAIHLLRLPPLVVTLATLALYRGLSYGLVGARPIGDWPESYTDWGTFGAWHVADSLRVPWTFLVMLGTVAVGTVLFHRHRLGRHSQQMGENVRASLYAGIAPWSVLLWIYSLSGLACGLSAVFWTARFATAHPAAAQGLELDVIAVVVIGGTRITGGAGSVPGSFLGLLLIGLLRYGLDLRSVSQQDQAILIGGLLILGAIFNEAWARRLVA